MAIDPNIVALINADVDGEISAADKEDLAALLADSPEAQAMHAELSGLGSSLNELPDLDPPVHLKHTIMASIPKTEAQQRRSNFAHAIFAAPAFRYAAMFAAGAILTLSLVNSDELSDRAFSDVTGLVGTISSELPDGPGIQSTRIDRPEIAGRISLRSSGPLLIVDFDLVSSGPVDIIASYADQTVWFNGFARRYALFLHNAGDRNISINLQFMSRGELVYDTDVKYTQPGQTG
jgi:hypothetical protein